MLSFTGGLKVFVALEPVDLRKSLSGLEGLVSARLGDSTSSDPSVLGVHRLHELIAAEPRVSATTIQTVGSKGYDGFTFALVTRK